MSPSGPPLPSSLCPGRVSTTLSNWVPGLDSPVTTARGWALPRLPGPRALRATAQGQAGASAASLWGHSPAESRSRCPPAGPPPGPRQVTRPWTLGLLPAPAARGQPGGGKRAHVCGVRARGSRTGGPGPRSSRPCADPGPRPSHGHRAHVLARPVHARGREPCRVSSIAACASHRPALSEPASEGKRRPSLQVPGSGSDGWGWRVEGGG